jgi:imidazolonepropionase-like amidohydrolase
MMRARSGAPGPRGALALAAICALAWTGRAEAEEAAPVAITHALVYVPGGLPPVADATVVLVGGKVQAVGANAAPPPGAQVLDAHGKTVTAGFIDADTDVGVVEVDLEPGSNDAAAGGLLTPALRVVDGYNPRSAVIPVTRAGGVTSVVVAPRGGALAGQGAFVDLAGETQAEAVVRPALAQYAQADEDEARALGARSQLWLVLRQALDDARFYAAHRAQYDANASRPLGLRRMDLEALLPVLRGEEPLVVRVQRASDIETALRFADEFRLKLVLSGASEAWLMRDEIAKAKVPVIIDPLEDLPASFDRLRSRSDNAAILAGAGVSVVISTFSSHNARLLWQRAGNAVRLGMDHDAAIRAVTEAPADAFGLKGYGRLEAGAIANVVVWSGDPLQIGTHVEHVFVRGREQSLETRQTLLLNRYRSVPFVHDGSR